MYYLIIGGQFLLCLSLLIILHEFGHFITARMFGMRVEKFYLFFDAWFSVFKKKIGETEYGIGWIPLGGYVKISGMIDESMDKEFLNAPPQPYEFRSKPAWQRLIVMLGGIIVNLLLGFLIFALVLLFYGREYVPSANLKWGIACDSVALKMGLKDGDRIISAGEYKCDEFNPGQIRRHIVIYNAQSLKINRGGQDMEIPVSPEYIDQLTSKEVEFVSIRFPFVIDSVAPGKAAAQAGLMKGDSLVAFNHDTVGFYHQFVNYFKANKGKEATLSVVRKGQPMDIKITPDQDGVIGVFNKTPANYLKAETETFGLNAFPRGVGLAISTLSDQLNAFGQMFKGKIKATKAMGGFASMASNFSPYWDWHRFWLLTATISIILAFMNLLPIPALDGGHVVFTLWEMITGRKPGDKFMEYAQVVGFVIVLALLLFANGMDIYRWFHK